MESLYKKTIRHKMMKEKYPVEEIMHGKRVLELLEEDNTFRPVPKNDSFWSQTFHKVRPEPKTKQREAYELGAKFYYKLGVNSDKLTPDNIIERNSELHRRVCTLLNKLGIAVVYNLHHGGLNLTIDEDRISELERVLKQEGI